EQQPDRGALLAPAGASGEDHHGPSARPVAHVGPSGRIYEEGANGLDQVRWQRAWPAHRAITAEVVLLVTEDLITADRLAFGVTEYPVAQRALPRIGCGTGGALPGTAQAACLLISAAVRLASRRGGVGVGSGRCLGRHGRLGRSLRWWRARGLASRRCARRHGGRRSAADRPGRCLAHGRGAAGLVSPSMDPKIRSPLTTWSPCTKLAIWPPVTWT